MSQNYKDTLHLPKTEFPMKADLVKREPERLQRWEKAGLYEQIQEARKDAELFVLHDGPPFANGDVHMGGLRISLRFTGKPVTRADWRQARLGRRGDRCS